MEFILFQFKDFLAADADRGETEVGGFCCWSCCCCLLRNWLLRTLSLIKELLLMFLLKPSFKRGDDCFKFEGKKGSSIENSNDFFKFEDVCNELKFQFVKVKLDKDSWDMFVLVESFQGPASVVIEGTVVAAAVAPLVLIPIVVLLFVLVPLLLSWVGFWFM